MIDEERDGYIEMWKQTITVQQHFNDIEMKIRSLALTVLTFVLGGASVAIRNGTTVRVRWFDLQLGTLILAFGLFMWIAFYMVDQIWYHRLLMGAVKHGEALEDELRKILPAAGLTHTISAASPYPLKISIWKGHVLWKHDLHSKEKMSLFYWFIAVLLIIFAAITQLTVRSSPSFNTVNSPGPTQSASARSSSPSAPTSSGSTPSVPAVDQAHIVHV